MAAQPLHTSPAVHKRFSRTSTASSSSVGEPSSSSSTGVGGAGSSWRSSAASSSSQNGRLTPASTRLRIDVPDNHRFVRPASSPPQSSVVQNGEDDAVMSSGSSDGYGEVGAGVRPSRCAVKDDEDGGPDVLHTVRPSHSFRRHEHDVPSDEEDGGADFHDANEWFPQSLEQGGFGLGLGFAVPSATSVHERRRCSGEESEPEHAGDVEHLRDSDAEGPLPDQLQQRRGSLPFPSRTLSSVPNYAYSDTSTTTATSEQDQQLSRPALNDLHRSTRVSTTTSSSNSSTLSLPTAPPVDLSLPNRQIGPYVSVANGPMASLASSNAPAQRPQTTSGARSFFANLLGRSPRLNSSPRLGSPTGSPSGSPNPAIPRSPSAPLDWQYQHPAVAALQSQGEVPHTRSTSIPSLAGRPLPRSSSDLYRFDPAEQPQRRTPRSLAAATFAGLTRSSSLRDPSAPQTSGASQASARQASTAGATHSPVPTIGLATPPMPSTSTPEPPSLASLGLSLVPLTQPLSLSRNAQPLCGAILDQKYLLIGTTAGLDFLPLPLPGSLPMQQLGKKRKETRKPVSLIKRTRFKELAVLSERSNILLAIAGRNDHVRVYALDGIRAMIDKKMQEIDKRDGYPIIHDAAIFDKKTSLSSGVKGKARAPGESRSADMLQPQAAAASVVQPAPSPSYQFPPTASTSAAAPFASQPLPPDDAPTPTPRRRPLSTHSRPPSYHQRPPSWHQGGGPASPVRISSRPTSASFVRAVPTNPAPPRGSVSSQTTVTPGTPRIVRGQKSRDFIAGRKGSTAASMPGMSKRRSRADLGSPPSPSSRRASLHSHVSRRGSTRSVGRAAAETADAETPPPVPSVDRRLSAPTHSLEPNGRRPSASPSLPARLDPYPAPMPFPPKRMEPRPPVKPLNPLERSPTSDLAEFLRDSGPDMRSPEMDNVLASSRRRRRSSVTDNLLQAGADAQLFPALHKLASRRESLPPSATASHLAGLELYTTGGSDLVEMLSEPALGDYGRASLSSSAGQSQPREARSPPLRSIERSPVLELADFIRQSGPLDDRPSSFSGDESIVPPRVPPKPEARSAMTPRLGAGQKSPSMELAELLRQTGPVDGFDTSAFSPILPTHSSGVGAESASAAISSTRQRAESTSGIAAREAALDRLTARSPVVDSDTVVPTELAELVRSEAPAQTGSASPSSRSSKRWTMSAVGSKLLHRTSTPEAPRRPPSAGQNVRPSLDSSRASSQRDLVPDHRQPLPHAATTTAAPSAPPAPHAGPTAAPVLSVDAARDRKRRPQASLHRSEPPTVAPSSQAPPDAHPANSASPLEYVKLARTRGARMLRATETKKRTYLAVLCGEEAERIELFTGSRSISLSLNRTFVLPEAPRTIEFQMQGDDLVDIYLVYPESIFALEPATVRVREVGVGRSERRARRERERRMRDVAATSAAPLANESGDEFRSANLHSALHPADHVRTEEQETTAAVPAGENITVPLNPASRSLSPSPAPDAVEPPTHEGPPPEYAAPPRERSRTISSTASSSASRAQAQVQAALRSIGSAAPVSSTSRAKAPYSTFQQLPFVPPVPSSVLSSAWTIPPLYSDVVAGSPVQPALDDALADADGHLPQPSITVTGAGPPSNGLGHQRDVSSDANLDIPLLSPISLLNGAAHRQIGPPGLFFVSKGKNLSGIVTADGKSVIKRPIVWGNDPLPVDPATEPPQRLEVLVLGGRRTVVVKLSPSDVKAISVEGASPTAPFSAATLVSPPPLARPAIQFLATHSAGQQLVFSQAVGQSFSIQCLAAARI